MQKWGIVLVGLCACHWQSTIQGPAAPASFSRPPASEHVEVVDRDARRTEIDPTSSLTIYFRGGGFTDPLQAGSLCQGPLGLYVGDDCASARLIARWDEIERIDIKGFDAVTSLFAGVGITVGTVVALAVVLFLRAPPPPVWTGNKRRDDDVQPHTVQPSGVDRTKPAPLFTATARRREDVTGLFQLDAGTCVYTNGFTGAFRAGVRFAHFVELTGGVRWLVDWATSGATASTLDPASTQLKWVGVAGLGFHAELPRLRWLAFYLGFEGGSGDIPFFFSIRPGLRFALSRELSIGIYPLSPTLVAGDKPGVPKGIQAPSSFEAALSF